MNGFPMATEILPIASCANRYAAGSDGSIYSLASGAALRMKPTACADGYLRVKVKCADGKRRMCAVHRLVAEAFHPNPSAKAVVNHKSGVKSDCSAGNLEWATHKENAVHAVLTGLHRPGASRDLVVVSEAKSLRARGRGLAQIAAAVGRSISTVHRYVTEPAEARKRSEARREASGL